eukprot:13378-Heterococcus_DN1.PRE.2
MKLAIGRSSKTLYLQYTKLRRCLCYITQKLNAHRCAANILLREDKNSLVAKAACALQKSAAHYMCWKYSSSTSSGTNFQVGEVFNRSVTAVSTRGLLGNPLLGRTGSAIKLRTYHAWSNCHAAKPDSIPSVMVNH